MPWPLSQDYNEAIQSPRTSFSDAELKTSEAAANALGIPMPRSGNFADVYEMRCPSGSRWAVKCFTREVFGLRERYAEISKYLRLAHLPFMVDFKYLEQGIRVRGQWYPILKMQWVEGFLLNEFVRDNLDKKPILQTLGQIWVRMARRLRESYIAHCDLQHGNVLFVPGSNAHSLAVKLIDYDGMCVPSLAGTTSGEVGHPAYQHAERLRSGAYNQEVDRFSLLSIATALRCLAIGGRPLWERYDTGDNLLFRQADLQAPASSPLFQELLATDDPQTRNLVSELFRACQGSLDAVPLVTDLLPEEHAPSTPKPATPKRTTVVKTAAVPSSPNTRTTATDSAWDFEGEGKRRSRRRRKGGMSRWVWGVAGGVAALVLVGGLFALAFRGATDKTKDDPRVAQAQTKKSTQRFATSQKAADSKKAQPDGDGQRKDGAETPSPIAPEATEPQGVGDSPTANVADGFVSLFNGKNLDGWKTHPDQPGNWRVVKGTNGDVLTGSGSQVSHLYSERGDYKDFHLLVEARINDGGHSGVYSRATFGPFFPKVEPRFPLGYEAQISNGKSGDAGQTGSLFAAPARSGEAAAVRSVRESPIRPEEWFKLEVIVEGNHIVIQVNGKTTADYTDDERRYFSGHIALKQLGADTVVEFRKIEIKELLAKSASPESPKPAVTDAFVSLFNGTDSTGWKSHPGDKGKWEVKDGLLIGSGGRGRLLSERGDYQNFHFRVEAMINDGGKSSQFFRAQFGPTLPKGYEVYINSTHKEPLKTGSLYGIYSVTDQLHKPDEWFTLEVIAEGDHLVIKVNDKTVVDKHNKRYSKGDFALQLNDAATVVKFRKIEVKELPANAAESSSRSVRSENPSTVTEVAAKDYEKSCAAARASLLKAFNIVLDKLSKVKGSTEAKLTMIQTVKEEKERFENEGLIPWSEPMRPYVERYFGVLATTQAKLARVYETLIDAQLRKKNDSAVADLRTELKNRLDIRVMARWRHFANGRRTGIPTLYSNGRVGNSEGKATWSYANGELIFRWPDPRAPKGVWIDRLHVSADGTTYAGTNNNPRPEFRPKLSGVYMKDN